MARARKLLLTAAVAAAALPLGGCEDTTFCGSPILAFLFCDPNENSSAPTTFDTNDGPIASFTADPARPAVGAAVTFSNTSHDPDGVLPGLQSIDKAEWDLDGDGTFETPGAPKWTNRGYRDDVSHTYATAGARTIRLRVTDWEGAEATVERTIQVGGEGASAPTGPGLRAAGATRPTHGFLARLTLLSFASANPPSGESRSAQGVVVRGRLSGSLTPAAAEPGVRLPRAPRALSRFLRAPVVASMDATTNSARTRQRITAVGLATLRGRPSGRVCFTLRLTNRAGRQPAGSLRRLGGTGAGARLFGSGTVRGELRSARLAQIGGTLRTRSGRSRGLPAACRGLT